MLARGLLRADRPPVSQTSLDFLKFVSFVNPATSPCELGKSGTKELSTVLWTRESLPESDPTEVSAGDGDWDQERERRPVEVPKPVLLVCDREERGDVKVDRNLTPTDGSEHGFRTN